MSPGCPDPSCSGYCDACLSVAQEGAGILASRNQLREVSDKGISNKRQVHFARLPVEMVSKIFEAYCDELREFPSSINKAPLVIGGVCRHWRDVTLAMPQLWSEVWIYPNRNRPYDINISAEWLRRSRSLSLSLNFFFGNIANPEDYTTFLPLINLVRSHSARWGLLDIDQSGFGSVSGFVHALLNNLEIIPSDLRTISLGTMSFESKHEYNMDRLLLPQTFDNYADESVMELPIGWDRLTTLKSSFSLDPDDFIHIIENAPLLTKCVFVPPPEDDFDEGLSVADEAVTSHSIISLDLKSPKDASECILNFLTLPSLEILSYVMPSIPNDPHFVVLHDFLDRSSPPLREFHLEFSFSEEIYDDVQRLMRGFTVTSLVVSFQHDLPGEEHAKLAKDFLSLLSQSDRLPQLRRLDFRVSVTPTQEFWSALCGFLQQHRSIQSVTIKLLERWTSNTRLCIDLSVFHGLVELEQAGLKFMVSINQGRGHDLEFPISTLLQING